MKTKQKRILIGAAGLFLAACVHAQATNHQAQKPADVLNMALGISTAWDNQMGCATNTTTDNKNKSTTFYFLLAVGQHSPQMPQIIAEHITEKDLVCKDGHAELTPAAYARLKNTPLL